MSEPLISVSGSGSMVCVELDDRTYFKAGESQWMTAFTRGGRTITRRMNPESQLSRWLDNIVGEHRGTKA